MTSPATTILYKIIPGLDRYQVGSDGSIWSFVRPDRPKRLRQTPTGPLLRFAGVSLYRPGDKKTMCGWFTGWWRRHSCHPGQALSMRSAT